MRDGARGKNSHDAANSGQGVARAALTYLVHQLVPLQPGEGKQALSAKETRCGADTDAMLEAIQAEGRGELGGGGAQGEVVQ